VEYTIRYILILLGSAIEISKNIHSKQNQKCMRHGDGFVGEWKQFCISKGSGSLSTGLMAALLMEGFPR